ncbi:MAG: hypothetical protein SVU94_04850 [Bacteroidota bacterium]|nr:hypothetical protein [Bacteroidota bacterium]
MKAKRKNHEQPLAIEKWGWRYHHIGMPAKAKIQDEKYIPHLKFSVGRFDTSPFGIEWMRFDDDSPLDEIIKTIPHIAFEVDNLEEALSCADFRILNQTNAPSKGVRVAMIEHQEAPIEGSV